MTRIELEQSVPFVSCIPAPGAVLPTCGKRMSSGPRAAGTLSALPSYLYSAAKSGWVSDWSDEYRADLAWDYPEEAGSSDGE